MYCILLFLPLTRFIFILFSALLTVVCLNGLSLNIISIKENNIYYSPSIVVTEQVHLILLLLLSEVFYRYSWSMLNIILNNYIIIQFKFNLFDVSYIVFHYVIASIPRYTICVSCPPFCRYSFQLQRLCFYCTLYTVSYCHSCFITYFEEQK